MTVLLSFFDPVELDVFFFEPEVLTVETGVVVVWYSLRGRLAKLFLLLGDDRSDLSLDTGSDRASSSRRRDRRIDGESDITKYTAIDT